jgi:hypothetical protein
MRGDFISSSVTLPSLSLLNPVLPCIDENTETMMPQPKHLSGLLPNQV